jgi:hypothetical protein
MNSNKRKRDSKESPSKRPQKEPRIGERPMLVMYLSWDQHPKILVRVERLGGCLRVKVLVKQIAEPVSADEASLYE